MNCVILQPSYIPWRGYFDQIRRADVFVFYDDAQYDKHGWRNRNRIKTAAGPQWLTVPVVSKGAVLNHTPIKDVGICWNTAWTIKHWKTLRLAYAKAPHFARYAPMLEEFYGRHQDRLADFTIDLTQSIAAALGIEDTRFVRSSSLSVAGSKTDRLISILQALGATHYISGPSAKDYLEEEKLQAVGITLEYIQYDYPEYAQLYPPFDPFVSVLDLLFMEGLGAGRYIWGEQT